MSWWSTCPGTCGTSDCAHVRRTTPPTARRIYRAFEGPEPDVRNMLERIVFTKEAWTAAIGGRDIPPRDQRTIAALEARLAAVQAQFTALVRRIRDRNEWDDVFVDALCAGVAYWLVRDKDDARRGRKDERTPFRSGPV